MTKLAKYLKPYILLLILSVGLLYGQAMCDLNLPNYMSNIVNVGLQQKGIENGSPDVISKNGYDFSKTLMTKEQQTLLEENYKLIKTGSEEAKSYEKKYPLVKTEDVYAIKKTDKDTREKLNYAFGQTGWTLMNVMDKMSEMQSQSGTAGQSSKKISTSTSGSMDLSNLDFNELYKIVPMINKMPESVLTDAQVKSGQNDESMIKQTGAALSAGYYKELGANVDSIQQAYIIKTGIIMLVIALLGGIATIMVGYLASKISSGAAKTIREDVFKKVESFSHAEFNKFSASSLITRTTNDVQQVQMLLMMGIRMLCYAPIMAVGGVVMAVRKSVSMVWIIAAACITLIGVIIVVFSLTISKFNSMQKLIDKLNLVAREHLSGLMVIKAFGTTKFEENRFDVANKDLTKTTRFVNRVMALMMPTMMFIMNAVSLLIVWVGAHEIQNATMQVGDMMAYIQYAMQIIMSFLVISMMFIMVPRAAVSGKRIAEVLATKPSIVEPEKKEEFVEREKGYVEFKNVSFKYDKHSEAVLENINFVARPGETTAIIGATGSGKSTLIDMIPRFYDVTEGEVLVDGIDVRNADLKELRKRVGFVPQKGVLLSGTIDSNLRYGKDDATVEEIEKAAMVAQATDFIEEKEDKFESPISQGGTNVSGGQKQRLSIARALAKNAEIYIFDDSFSALDFKTDSNLRKALKEYTGESTVIIVAQRVSTIMNAEQILVLDEGKIVGKGTHKELLKTCPVYYEIAASQLSKEELDNE